VNPTLLLIRPAGSNDQLAGAFTALGWPVIERPLTRITSVDEGVDDRRLAMSLDRFDHVIFVSQHAVLTGLPRLAAFWSQWPSGLRWYAVGERTAMILENEGAPEVLFPAVSGSTGLLSLQPLVDAADSAVLIVKGEDGLDDLENTLLERQARVENLTTYQRELCNGDRVEHQINGYVVPVYNSSVLPGLKSVLMDVPDHHQVLVAVSERIAEAATAIGFKKVLISSGLEQIAVATCIESARRWLPYDKP